MPAQPAHPTVRHSQRWRIALVLAGAAMAYGGSLHPDADAEDSLREELATMTASDDWVRSHVFIAVGTGLLALGLWSAHRERSWPTATRRALHIAAITMSLYVVETIFHLASVVDADALADGDPAPIAFAHVGLAVVLYPISGLGFAWLNARLFRAVDLSRTPLAAVGVVAGLLHAASVPLTLALPDTEFTAVFAGAGMLFAIWSLGFGLLGIGTRPSDDPDGIRDGHDRSARSRGSVDPERAAAYRVAERRDRLGRTAHSVEICRLGVSGAGG